jgi:hypothetical protein
MYCSNCGTELPDNANFCVKCGKPQREGAQPIAVKYETCVIMWKTKDTKIKWIGKTETEMSFWAEAIGSKGLYNAGESESVIFYGDYPSIQQNDKAEAAVNSLIKKLGSDGWESTGKGKSWYGYTFRRVIKDS